MNAALIISLAILALIVWAIVDVARKPSTILPSRRKAAWIGGLVLGALVFEIAGVVIALVYLIGVRPRLARAAADLHDW